MEENDNIIVYGTRRTGTSLFMDILGSDGTYKILDGKGIDGDDYDKLQPSYNESKFVSGINKYKLQDYKTHSKKLIKLLGIGIVNTEFCVFDNIKHIFVMNRYWVNQTISLNNLNKINADNQILTHKELLKNIKNMDEFYEDYNYCDGIEYGYYYSLFVKDILARNYLNKITIINYEQLFTNFQSIKDIIKTRAHLIVDDDKLNIDISKYSEIKSKNCLREFKPGFFDFLDTLYVSIRDGNITQKLLNLIHIWEPHMLVAIEYRSITLYKKYKLVINKPNLNVSD